MKILAYIKHNKLLIAILALGLFLRLYGARAMFLYGHDADLAGWFVRDIVDNHHFRLIGQETSTAGIFIGPYYYYLLVPFYLLFNMDPLGGVAMVTLLGLFTIFSVYLVFTKIVNRDFGIISAFMYAVSVYAIVNDREVVPTMPVIAWTVWFLYAIYLLFQKKQATSFIVFGILIGLIWNLNFALVLLVPLIIIALIVSKTKLNYKALLKGVSAFALTALPLILFEVRHSFIQTKALVLSLTTKQSDIISGWDKFIRTLDLLGKDISAIVWGNFGLVGYKTTLFLFILAFVFLTVRKVISKKYALIFSSWIVVYIIFFSLYSKRLSEYYLNGTVVIWLFIMASFIYYLLKRKSILLAVFMLAGFGVLNLQRFFALPVNRSGYVQRRALVTEIKADAAEMGYPCVSVSYITDPGYNLGYRYFFYLENLHVNLPKSLSPVYTIVYPLNDKLFPVGATFGSLGLIYPDYARYTKEGVKTSCKGDNANLYEPMWGFTN